MSAPRSLRKNADDGGGLTLGGVREHLGDLPAREVTRPRPEGDLNFAGARGGADGDPLKAELTRTRKVREGAHDRPGELVMAGVEQMAAPKRDDAPPKAIVHAYSSYVWVHRSLTANTHPAEQF